MKSSFKIEFLEMMYLNSYGTVAQLSGTPYRLLDTSYLSIKNVNFGS